MISFEQAMAAMSDERIASLKVEMLDAEDILNLILQRSEIIRDQNRPNWHIKQWTEGEDGPLLDLIARVGPSELARRAAAFIYLEYLELKPVFDQAPLRRIADIGCGYAFFDLFLAQDFGCRLVLIDLEQSGHRHFGYENEGAAYSNLDVARAFLTMNGVDDADIDTRNPGRDDLGDIDGLDYALSFISCGFHYPWHTYRDFFARALRPGGMTILDVRRRVSGDARAEMAKMGRVKIVAQAAYGRADRVMLTLDGTADGIAGGGR